MRRRFVIALLTMVVAALAVSMPVLAGGWAVTSLDQVPEEFEAGTVYPIGFTILQHGKTPVDTTDGMIEIRSTTTGELLHFSGVPDGTPGHYVAQVSFPSAGTWEWTVIQGMFGPQELGMVTVQAPVAAVGATSTSGLTDSGIVRVALPVAALALAVLFVVQLVSFRRVRRASARTEVPSGTPAAGD